MYDRSRESSGLSVDLAGAWGRRCSLGEDEVLQEQRMIKSKDKKTCRLVRINFWGPSTRAWQHGTSLKFADNHRSVISLPSEETALLPGRPPPSWGKPSDFPSLPPSLPLSLPSSLVIFPATIPQNRHTPPPHVCWRLTSKWPFPTPDARVGILVRRISSPNPWKESYPGNRCPPGRIWREGEGGGRWWCDGAGGWEGGRWRRVDGRSGG